MRRIRCPDCDRNLKIPDEFQRKRVRCPCGQTIDLEDAEDVPKTRPEPRKASRRPVRDDEGDDRPRVRKRSAIRGLIPLAIILPLGLVLLVLAPFYKEAARAGFLMGFPVIIAAIIFASKSFKKKGFDEDMANVPILLRGGGAMLYYQVKYAIQYPRLLACWVILQYFGMALMITAGILFESVNWAAKEHPHVPPVVQEAPRVTGDAKLDKLLADLNVGDTNKTRLAAEQLSKMAPDEANRRKVVEKLLAVVNISNVFAREQVIYALGVWGTNNEVPVLLALLDSPDISTRQHVLKVIGHFKDERTIKPVMRCFVEVRTRREAEKASQEMGSMVENDLLPLLKEKDPTAQFLRMAVVRVLKEVGTQMSVPDLQALADSDDFLLKNDAQQALQAIAARGK